MRRYEFLLRVSEGALPGSFSRECYEDILSFKSKVLSKFRKINAKYQQQNDETDEIIIAVLKLDKQNQLGKRLIPIKTGIDQND